MPAGPVLVAGYAISISYSQSLRRCVPVQGGGRSDVFCALPWGSIQRQPSGPGFLTLFVRHLIVVAWRHLNTPLFIALYEDTVELVVIKQQNLISFLFNPLSRKGIRSWHEICLQNPSSSIDGCRVRPRLKHIRATLTNIFHVQEIDQIAVMQFYAYCNFGF